MTRARLLIAVAVITAFATTPAVGRPADQPDATRALARLAQHQPGLIARAAPERGAYDSVRAPAGAVLVRDDAGAPAEQRARRFLADHGAVLGVDDPAALALVSTYSDRITGVTHVRFDQRHGSLPVFGALVLVHMDERGIRGANGVFVPARDLPAAPEVSADDAAALARVTVREATGARALRAGTPELLVYDTGVIAHTPGRARLAWLVEVEGDVVSDQVFIDATDRVVLNRIERIHAARNRCVYTPTYMPEEPDLFVARAEGDPPTNIPPVDNLYDFSGDVYDLFERAFGRDSFDGAGGKMRTVYEVGPICPNAFYRGSTRSTHYCPGFDTDDIVAHEWAHGYTDFTHDLIYQNQPGALNESYSDIWGEVIDLTNDWDGIGGDNNAEPYPDGVRWVVGEDLTEPVGEALALRDMWDPERRGLPSKVSSPSYVCTADNGGVHFNSSVPNHAFAMLVDGKEFNGHTVAAIGMDKAAHIYWQAQVAYQTPTSGFAEHAEALAAGCADLLGINVNGITTGVPIAEPVTTYDCAQVDEAMLAVEMVEPPAPCGGPLLKAGSPAVCPGAVTLLAEDFEDGLAGWELGSVGATPDRWPGTNWIAEGGLPDDRPGNAAFARNTSGASGCAAPGDNHTGRYSITSAALSAPADGSRVTIHLDHYVASEAVSDGGNLMVAVNDGSFEPVPASAFTFNAPNVTLTGGGAKDGQDGWSGGDTQRLRGSWATSVADLSGIVSPGDSFRIRFEFGQDCTAAWLGWFVDDVTVVACPPVPAPALRTGEDYEDPDTDGTFTLEWDRPESAAGPEELQMARVRPPLIADDAENGMDDWVVTSDGLALTWQTTPLKQGAEGMTFTAVPNEAAIEGSTIMTTAEPMALPAGDVTLRFKDYLNDEPSDSVAVEVSTDGSDWTPVYTNADPGRSVVEQVEPYLTDELVQREIDLSAYGGSSLHLRFRYTHSIPLWIDVARFGWYVDDIEVTAVGWEDIPVEGTSHTMIGVPGGYDYLARVRSTYDFGDGPAPGDWSDPLLLTVG